MTLEENKFNDEMTVDEIFNDFRDELKKDLKRRGSFWSPLLITNKTEGRTVVLRSLQEGKLNFEDLIVHTDIRSKKWDELKKDPLTSLVFYCPKRKWQIRVKANARLNFNDIEAKIEWERLSPASRKIYSLKFIPGSPIPSPQEGYVFSEKDGYENFGVLTLVPHSLESLQLSHPMREDFHVRAFWDLLTHEKSFLTP